MIKALLAAAMLLVLGSPAHCREWTLLQLDQASAEYRHFSNSNFNAYYNGHEKDYIAVDVDSTVLRYLFFNSRVHGTSDQGQYRQIGLQLYVGIRLSRYIDLQYYHHSQHLLDTTDPYKRHYPMEDSIGATIYFYRSDNREALLE